MESRGYNLNKYGGLLREAIIGVSSDDNHVSVIKSISMSLSDINEMISGILLRTYRELMRVVFKGGEVGAFVSNYI